MKNQMAKYIKLPVRVFSGSYIEVLDSENAPIATCGRNESGSVGLERAGWIKVALNEYAESRKSLDFAAKIIDRQSQEKVKLLDACQYVLESLDVGGEQGRAFSEEIKRLKAALFFVGATPGAKVTEVKR